MAIVETYRFGKSIVEVDDSCIKYRTPEEIQGVMDRIGQISYQSDLRKKLRAEQQEEKVR